MVAAGPLAPARAWRVRGRDLPLDRPIVMGIVNVTPDSFSDGGRFTSTDAARVHADRLIAEGADILDVGGESTAPGAAPVEAGEELRRVLPVLRALRHDHQQVLLSVDTVKATVAAQALDVGVQIVNDVSGLRLDPAMGGVLADAEAGVILMHSRGGVADMATYAHAGYGPDPVGEVIGELIAGRDRAREAGIADTTLALDPGIGFSKRSDVSLALLRDLPRLAGLGHPVAVGASRKRFVGEITGTATPRDRLAGTLGACVMALARGARIFRVHDVGAARQALDVAWAISGAGEGEGDG